MESLGQIAALSDQALLLALSTTRIAVAFLLLPLFTGDLIPATVRNAIYLAFGIIALSLQPLATNAQVTQVNWILLFAKEAFIGGGVGFLFGSILWAFEAAGSLIDTKIGATTAQVTDPLSGQQTPLTGAFLGRLANFVFMFSGGLLVLVGTLLDTYALWPVLAPAPVLWAAGGAVFEAEFGRLTHADFRSEAFLREHIRHTMAFYHPRCIDPAGGFFHYFKDDGRVYDA
ncbi:MAG: flagellar biosynthetic protein FliR, partial [Rhizobacter sp.]